MGNVHQTAGQVTGLRGAQSGVGQALAGAVLGDEVFQGGQAVLGVGFDRPGNDLALRVRHEASHSGDLADLHPVASGAGADHDVEIVVREEVLLHAVGDRVGAFGP